MECELYLNFLKSNQFASALTVIMKNGNNLLFTEHGKIIMALTKGSLQNGTYITPFCVLKKKDSFQYAEKTLERKTHKPTVITCEKWDWYKEIWYFTIYMYYSEQEQ